MALDSREFLVSVSSDSSFGALRRVYINPDVLKATKVSTGDIVFVRGAAAFAVGLAWPSQSVSPAHICISAHSALTARLSDGATAQLGVVSNSTSTPDIPVANKITYFRIDGSSRESNKRKWLAALVKEILIEIRFIAPHQIIEADFYGQIYQFKLRWEHDEIGKNHAEEFLINGVKSMSLSTDSSHEMLGDICRVNWETEVVEGREELREATTHKVLESGLKVSRALSHPPENLYASIGGLDKQIEEIKDLVELPLQRPDLFLRFGLKPPRGILLHGPPGTGKTRLAHAVASSTMASVIVVHGPELSSAYHGETEAKLRDVFARAKKQSPCIIVLDELDALCPRRDDSTAEVEKRVVATMLTLLDGMEEQDSSSVRVLVIGTTNRPNAIDPALRRPGRFDREIEIGIPDAPARYAILRVLLSKIPHSLDNATLKTLANNSHGYVGADLSALVRDAGTLALHRWLQSTSASQNDCDATLALSDMLTAMATIRPSAMREVFVETPQVRWSDIGGQAFVKEKLKECVEWPLLHPDAFTRLGITPPKGVLLYGPPGCSKTLTAKALATESGINFLAVKGPELLNKFVGESERAVREIFRKARAAAPSIIFFDEIDALGSSRVSSDLSSSSNEGMLTSLLNEMDGIQELVNVTIVAATNRPEVMDPALMRPGRLDRILYVGPPDFAARVEILGIRTRQMAVEPSVDLAELAMKTDGCSGAELVSMCQDAALAAMKENMNAPSVARKHFLLAANRVRRQITPSTIQRYEQWQASSGIKSA